MLLTTIIIQSSEVSFTTINNTSQDISVPWKSGLTYSIVMNDGEY